MVNQGAQFNRSSSLDRSQVKSHRTTATTVRSSSGNVLPAVRWALAAITCQKTDVTIFKSHPHGLPGEAATLQAEPPIAHQDAGPEQLSRTAERIGPNGDMRNNSAARQTLTNRILFPKRIKGRDL